MIICLANIQFYFKYIKHFTKKITFNVFYTNTCNALLAE
jgi:hypothetical protein